ncbi:hypothetical protein CDL12_12070 [Handroanthus impetiginosus]|uniref:TF-B3 domain-containing protein n=1 Tax=Handroanthus impetiginosus TaxID=429701 RepID=A0A2G9HCM0_9LAMI|nr:hypothetical protein CDL12_12070 [Handroanthus impetiginosus]
MENHLNAISSALDCSQGIQANPLAEYPSFLKQLLKSHLSGKFYLGLPKKFCDAHLPSHDDTIVLVDENEQEYSTKYSVRKNRLSGGWRGFSVAHKLLEGDALVFHLIEPCKFKVYIVRAGKLTENDGTMDLQSYDFQNTMPISTVKIEDQTKQNALIGEKGRRIYRNSLSVDGHQKKKKARSISDRKLIVDQAGNATAHFGSDVLESIRYSDSVLHFKDVKGFQDFKIQVDGLILDSEIPTDLRTNSKLAVVMISETVEIADAIRSANLATSLHRFDCWEKTLKAFEDLGMKVGFLRDRLHKLVSLLHESEVIESMITKRAEADEKIANFDTASLNVKGLIGNLEAGVKVLKLKNEKIGFEFQDVAWAPW